MSKTIQIMSDLHFEFHRDGGMSFVASLDPSGVDLLVLAGDIMTARFYEQSLQSIKMLCERYPAVLMVPGNHEYYGSDAQEAHNTLLALQEKLPNFKLLDCGFWEWSGTRFVGGTMWFPETEACMWYRHALADFDEIRRFMPWVFEQNRRFVELVERELRPDDIVITHHLPSIASVPKRFANSPINAFFVHDMTRLIKERKPALWIHGHTHDRCDYMLSNTRVISNPHGYPNERSCVLFDPKLRLTL